MSLCREVRMIRYKLTSETILDDHKEKRVAYGIRVCKNSTPIKTVCDISDDKVAVEKLIKDFNDYELDICHLEQAVEDFLYDLNN